jgi:HEAT repeat protein
MSKYADKHEIRSLVNMLSKTYRDESTWSMVVEELADHGREAVGPLIDALHDEDRAARYGAARVLFWIGPDARAAVPALSELLQDEDRSVRCEAADALGAIGPDARCAIPALTMSVLTDQDPDVRLSAAAALSGGERS